jgi:hypothetical protein
MGIYSTARQNTGLFPFSGTLDINNKEADKKQRGKVQRSLLCFFQSGGAQALPPSNKNYAVKMVRRPFLLDYSTGVQWPAP